MSPRRPTPAGAAVLDALARMRQTAEPPMFEAEVRTTHDAREAVGPMGPVAHDRAAIVAAIASRFSCYGQGTQVTRHNPVAVTLAEQPAQFAFGVPVADVVDAVLELAGVPTSTDAQNSTKVEK